jgi:ribosomal protein S27E
LGAPGLIEFLIVGLISVVAFVAVTAFILFLVNRKPGAGGSEHYGRIRCPECSESIVAEAIKCRFCGANLGDDDIGEPENSSVV